MYEGCLKKLFMILLIVGCFAASLFCAAPMAPTDLKTEYCRNPLGIDNPSPRFSWQVNDADRGDIQTAYQVVVENGNGNTWNSGKVISSRQNGVAYTGMPLSSAEIYLWKVKTWDKDSVESPWSSVDTFETGLLTVSDWKGVWIGGSCNLLRSNLVLDPIKTIAKARLYVTSLGYNETYINGRKAGDHVLEPGFTKYDKRALYSTYDITGLLNTGNNGIGIMLGNAYYGEHQIPPLSISSSYYNSSSLWALLEIRVTYTDGNTTRFGSNTTTFKALKGGPVTSDHVFNGESYDARNELPGWSDYGFNDGSWALPTTMTYTGIIKSQLLPIRVVEDISPVSVTQPTANVFVFDMGVNMVGWAKLTVNGPAGTTVTLKFAEVLTSDGFVNQTDLRSAECTDYFTLKGDGNEVWEPRFTYHGFRYIEVTGFPGTPSIDAITGRVIRSDYAAVNSFTCSNNLINNIYKMYSRSQRGNSTGIPSDCPQRDERQGWGADAVVTSEAALLSFDMNNFYEKWFNDIDDSQKGDGSIPATVPDFHDVGTDIVWESMRVLIPWDLYVTTGDSYPLALHYAKMKSFVASAAGLPATWGDWVPAGATEAASFFASAYYYQNLITMAKIAGALGKTADHEAYTNLARTHLNTFNSTHLKNNSYYGSNTQSGNAVALYFDIVPPSFKESVLANLISNIQSNNNHLTTGIVGSKAIMEALWKNSRSDVAYTLMTQTTYPSWGYMYNMGPGTIWEKWNSNTAIGSGMNSNNHVMYGGGPGAWVYKAIAGISALKPGYEIITIKPEVVGDITYASGSVSSVRGLVRSDWKIESNGTFTLNAAIPCNTTAEVFISKRNYKSDWVVQETMGLCWRSGEFVAGAAGISSGTDTGAFIKLSVGSGNYSFSAGPASLISIIEAPIRAKQGITALIGVSPNPFKPESRICYSLKEKGFPSLAIYSLSGALIKRLEAGFMDAGVHHAVWDGTGLDGKRVSTGQYICRLSAGNKILTKRIVLLK